MRAQAESRISLDDFRHEALDEVGSTNTACLERARAGDAGPLWITAARQTGGRGRRGRVWVSERGNLYSSLLLVDPAPREALSSLPLVVALAVWRAVKAALPLGAAPAEIKWPNDILIGRRKTSGILIEAENLEGNRQAVVIGIGINVGFKPDAPLYPVTCLQDEGSAISPEELFAHLFGAMAEALALWNRGKGLALIAADWRKAACGIGERITVNLPDRSLTGQFQGIDDDGLLKLDLGKGQVMMIASGDVFFG